MNQKIAFLTCATAAALSLSCACLTILALIANNYVSPDRGISVFNLLVDIVIGFLTVWGLLWAATEFAESAVRPVLQLLPGREKAPHALDTGEEPSLIPKPPFSVPGWFWNSLIGGPPLRDRHLTCGVYLKNKKSKAGRFVHVVMRVQATPAPTRCEFRYGEAFPDKSPLMIDAERETRDDCFTLSVRLADEVVVYQPPVYIGYLKVHWAPLPDAKAPRRLLIDYDIHTLDGTSQGKWDLLIEWTESVQG